MGMDFINRYGVKNIGRAAVMALLLGCLTGCAAEEAGGQDAKSAQAGTETVLEESGTVGAEEGEGSVSGEEASYGESGAGEDSGEDAEEEKVIVTSAGIVATSLGIPTEESYPSYIINARNPWDMILEDGKLYLGSGDYDTNAGPVDMWCYDIENEEWIDTGTVREEAIQRFVRIGDKVMAPGIDPKDGWNMGNYYVLEDGEWVQHRTVPNGVHMYDIVEYEGGRFYGIGTDTDRVSPVQLTRDGDETFEDVPFMKEGELLFGNNDYGRCRVYDFFVLNGELYCMCQAHDSTKSYKKLDAIFQYDGDAFQYVGLNFLNSGTTDARQIHIYEKVYFGDACYYANGKLKKTADLQEIETLSLPDKGDVEDLLVDYDETTGQEELYILSKKRSDKIYRSTIWKYIDDENFEEVCYFESEVGGMSFTKYGENFFVGLGANVGSYAAKIDIGEIIYLSRQ